MLQTITDAIRNRLVLTFTYSGITRIVEPHAVGISKAGNLILRCYQTHGGHMDRPEHWRYSSARDYQGQPGLIGIDRWC